MRFIGPSMDKGYSSAFAETVYRSNWRLSWQSPRLATLVKDVEAFLHLGPDLEDDFPLSDDSYGDKEMLLALRKIENDFKTWAEKDPKEYANRFAAHASEFQDELEWMMGGDGVLIPAISSEDDLFGSPPIVAENEHRGYIALFAERGKRAERAGPKRHRLAEDWKAGNEWVAGKEPKHYRPFTTAEKAKGGAPEVLEAGLEKVKEGTPEVLEAGVKAVDVGMFAAAPSVIKGVGVGLGSAVTAGAAVLATAAEGVSAGAGVLVEVGMSVAALRSVSSTAERLRYLKKIRDKIHEFDPEKDCPDGDPKCFSAWALIHRWGPLRTSRTSACGPFDAEVHDKIAHQVLDYIISKKEKKLGMKTAVAFGLGTEATAFKAIKGATKALKETKGVHRYKAAHWLAYHFCVCHCQLAMHMVAALTSDKEMYWLMNNGDYEGISGVLAEKIKST
jgi:hypothetical protein